jgi:hypothetical protein
MDFSSKWHGATSIHTYGDTVAVHPGVHCSQVMCRLGLCHVTMLISICGRQSSTSFDPCIATTSVCVRACASHPLCDLLETARLHLVTTGIFFLNCFRLCLCFPVSASVSVSTCLSTRLTQSCPSHSYPINPHENEVCWSLLGRF